MLSPLYGQLSPLRVPTTMRFISNDADVVAYVLAVEAADGQRLEDGVISAYESFITGCKADGIWAALKASCLLAGARTLSGALVPLVGTAPTNFNFVSGDYNRVTGLKGNGTTKYLSTNRSNNADPQNSKHLSIYASERATVNSWYIGGDANTTGHSYIYLGNLLRMVINANSAGNLGFTHANGLMGVTRANATTVQGRANKTTVGNGSTTIAVSSQTPVNFVNHVFKRSIGNDSYTAARLSFYSIGEHIDLAKLDTRVSTLMTALTAAIP